MPGSGPLQNRQGGAAPCLEGSIPSPRRGCKRWVLWRRESESASRRPIEIEHHSGGHGRDLVIEAVPEQLDVKLAVMKEIDSVVSEQTIVGLRRAWWLA
jgi:3-hydroxyacyl-CoA dehydrogenase, NAD binding domain